MRSAESIARAAGACVERRVRLHRSAQAELRALFAARGVQAVYGGRVVTLVLTRWAACFPDAAAPTEGELRRMFADLAADGVLAALPGESGMFVVLFAGLN